MFASFGSMIIARFFFFFFFFFIIIIIIIIGVCIMAEIIDGTVSVREAVDRTRDLFLLHSQLYSSEYRIVMWASLPSILLYDRQAINSEFRMQIRPSYELAQFTGFETWIRQRTNQVTSFLFFLKKSNLLLSEGCN